MSRASVLIATSDSDFAAMVMSRWQAEREVPSFVLVSQELWNILLTSELSGVARTAGYDLMILGPLPNAKSGECLRHLDGLNVPAIHVTRDSDLWRNRRNASPNLILIPEQDGWLDAVVLISGEVLRRVAALRAMCDAERSAALVARPAALGRFMLEARHSISNALTSILGNAELLLSETEQPHSPASSCAETIQAMALRLDGIMRRFSSLSSELEFTERPSQHETVARADSLVSVSEVN